MPANTTRRSTGSGQRSAKGKFARLKRKVLQRPQYLYDLNALKPDLSLRGSCYSGIQVVPIRSIIGSEGRVGGLRYRLPSDQ